LKNCLGLTPGHYRICIGSLAGVSDDGHRMVKDLLDSEADAATAYFADHRGCMDCKSFVVCGSRFAPLAAGGCGNALRQLAEQLQSSAAEIRTNLSVESMAPV
jgi:diaminopimelate epimerase